MRRAAFLHCYVNSQKDFHEKINIIFYYYGNND